tara:strand:- start:3904 stop:4347 length:444 start_codon:yes stop_codon:yes gene_type:complete
MDARNENLCDEIALTIATQARQLMVGITQRSSQIINPLQLEIALELLFVPRTVIEETRTPRVIKHHHATKAMQKAVCILYPYTLTANARRAFAHAVDIICAEIVDAGYQKTKQYHNNVVVNVPGIASQSQSQSDYTDIQRTLQHFRC